MLIPFIIYSIFLVIVGIFSLYRWRNKKIQKYFAPGVITLASIVVFGYLIWIFRWIGSDTISNLMGWQLPFAGLLFGIDPLSAFFLIPLLILAASCALYGSQYFGRHPAGRSHWFFFSLLVSGMVMVLLARNAMLFILAWEIMSLASFFLVITDKDKPDSIRAGWIYFVTAHVGTAFLLALFLLISSSAGSMDFAAWKGVSFSAGKADLVFIFALIAFGMKAGFIPFHVWLPLAHPAAPSHVSALMSGIMIKMGIYGIFRMLTFIMPYHTWWGLLLIALGGLSGVLGVLFAIGQPDIKRLLAYSSVENIGIILLGMGIGMTGAVYGSNVIALCGFGGALLHVVNHALFKGLLFMGAGAVIRQTGSGEIDRLGGVMKQMPRTGLLFFAGAAAICGLPFFNGFISELFIYLAGISGAGQHTQSLLAMSSLAVVAALALIGGLALACFTKLFGIVFLGEPRAQELRASGEVPVAMLWAMTLLAVLCLAIGIGSVVAFHLVLGPAIIFAGPAAVAVEPALAAMAWTVSAILGLVALLAAAVAGLIKIRDRNKRPAAEGLTWDCGYILPSPSMQYTGSSFSSPIVEHFKTPLGANQKFFSAPGFLPSNKWSFHSAVEDWFLTRIYEPFLKTLDRAFSSLHWFQNGKTGQYVLYIAMAVLGLIIWKILL